VQHGLELAVLLNRQRDRGGAIVSPAQSAHS
jgi:hypothetical protein